MINRFFLNNKIKNILPCKFYSDINKLNDFEVYQKKYNKLYDIKQELLNKYSKISYLKLFNLSYENNSYEILNEYIESINLYYKFRISVTNFNSFKYMLSIYYFNIIFFIFKLLIGFLLWNILSKVYSPEDLKNIIYSLFFNKKSMIIKTNKSFEDVIGIDEYKEEVIDIVNFLKYPKKYNNSGAEIPKGILLVGNPGTGKTLLAKAIAGESGCNFIYKSASEFEDKYVGVGSKNVKELFELARKKSPCIIFIDEIDSIAGKRNADANGLSRETLNQILTEMDGFRENNKIIVWAATNHYDAWDDAILRPGRFDKTINIPYPNIKGRLDMLKYYLKNINYNKNIDLEFLSKKTYNFTGADIKNLINMAIIESIKKKKDKPDKLDFEEALDRVAIGINNKSMKFTKDDLYKTAIHEGGHTLVALLTKGANTVDKVTILPRGKALGFTKYVMDKEEFKVTNQQLSAMIDTSLGGRVAEEVLFGNKEISTGCSSDLDHATKLAYRYILNFGMYKNLENYNLICLNKEDLSDNYKYILDTYVQNILKTSLKRTQDLLFKNKEILIKLADELMIKETLTKDDLDLILNK